jgi:hypothetical protein
LSSSVTSVRATVALMPMEPNHVGATHAQ